MISFIAEHRNSLGVEPVCTLPGRVLRSNAREGGLPIAQSTFYAHAAIARDPELASDRAKRDAVLCPEIKRVWEANHEVYHCPAGDVYIAERGYPESLASITARGI